MNTKFSTQAKQNKSTTCFHCGDICPDLTVEFEHKYFCCEGCRFVFELLDKNNLCNYYDLNEHPGNTLKAPKQNKKFEFLKEEAIEEKLISFKNKNYSVVSLYLPGIHCSSCLWLLQNLNRFDSGIISSNVSFEKKELKVIYKQKETNLYKIASRADSLGYTP
ncbi:MAG: heavy metal translocating P-type ATPase metal-binding domain-containing protein, partial [Bacteroidetes bacterium]|nr:heavy metal translocating P-type ATPase metal-binding domain-containing protein [Bacteroidota bacterium]